MSKVKSTVYMTDEERDGAGEKALLVNLRCFCTPCTTLWISVDRVESHSHVYQPRVFADDEVGRGPWSVDETVA